MMEIELDMENEVICAAVWFYPNLNWGISACKFSGAEESLIPDAPK